MPAYLLGWYLHGCIITVLRVYCTGFEHSLYVGRFHTASVFLASSETSLYSIRLWVGLPKNDLDKHVSPYASTCIS
jgi:hypothetical protein